MSGSTSQVDETALSEEDDVAAVLHEEAVDLGLDVLDGSSVLLQPGNINLDIEVPNIADDGIIGHLLEVLAGKDISATGCGNKDLTLASSLLHGCDLVTGNSSLESVDRVDLGDEDTSTHAVKSHSTTLSDITEASNDGNLTGDHDIGGTLDTVDQGLTATVKVVELGLGD